MQLSRDQRSELERIVVGKLQSTRNITDEQIARTIPCSARTVRTSRQTMTRYGTIVPERPWVDLEK